MLELARLSDGQAINTLARQIHEVHISWRPDIYTMPQILYPEARIREEIQNRNLYVARIGDAVVGYVLLEIRMIEKTGLVKRKIMHIHELCVEQSCRGQGIGTQIMAEVRILAKAFGCTDLQLGVYPQNDEAVSFYQKCGFMIQSITMQRKV